MKNKRLFGIMLTVAILLLIPFLAMKFTGEVNWSPVDFITTGVLLLGTGLACELGLRTVTKPLRRIALSAAILKARSPHLVRTGSRTIRYALRWILRAHLNQIEGALSGRISFLCAALVVASARPVFPRYHLA